MLLPWRLPAVTGRIRRAVMNRSSIPVLFAAITLAGCSSIEGEFPSLERRPFEQGMSVQEPVIPPTPVATSLPDGMQGKVNALQARHTKAAAAFDAMLPGVRATANAAAASANGSEAWVNAHLEVSRLDKIRSDAPAALAELDDLLLGQLEAESQSVILLLSPLLIPVHQSMADSVARQNAEIERLSNLIGQ